MPFCTKCGTEVDVQAAFCRNCGAPQGARPGFTPPHAPHPDFFAGMTDRTACLLCYIPVCGILPSVICLAAHRYRTNYRVRFHAFQGLYIFVAWLIASSIGPTLGGGWPGGPGAALDHIGDLARVLVLVCWMYMLVKVSQNEDAHLPILGDLAVRSTREQL